ncbi:MAG: putative oxygen-independent coproporphyrinogen oxidase [Herbinix sp.]|jgi:oxygen-independent coproporphyrinogen-3 oxidase|nr:putative oxygen-independent coproporphyrinogen oxidase [Herbinix sp.]
MEKMKVSKTEDVIENMMENVKEDRRPLGLYIHIPFCVKKCDYCDFLSAPATETMKKRYVDALITEIKGSGSFYSTYEVQTIFFGGGTPSCLEASEIERIMKAIGETIRLSRASMEVSIEVNPGTLTEEKLRVYKRAGINRLSFGLQSANDKELKNLGRIHTYQQFKENFLLARTLGFQNINVDLMSALPEQTVESWENTLRTIIALAPEHISAYSLIVEEGTGFYERYREGSAGYRLLPDEDTDRSIYHLTKEILKDNGYDRYEISNYAKQGFECRHNSSYWIGIDYLGLGLGASSLIQGVRFSKEEDLQKYILLCEQGAVTLERDKPDQLVDSLGLVRDRDQLTLVQRMEEFMFLGLRMCKGISKREFNHRFQKSIKETYPEIIDELVEKALLIEDGDLIRLTDLGIDVSNQVLAEFLLE